jgi:hypothetical protein
MTEVERSPRTSVASVDLRRPGRRERPVATTLDEPLHDAL